MEVADCGREAHDQTARAAKSETLGAGGSSPGAPLERMDWKETHLEPAKKAAEAALVEYMSISKAAGQYLALEEVMLAGKRFPGQGLRAGLGVVIQ